MTSDKGNHDALFRVLLEQLPARIWATDLDLRVTRVIGRYAEANSLTPVGRSIVETWGPEDAVGAVAAHRRALAGESVEHEAEIDGVILASQIEPLRDEAGTIVGVVGVAVDITDTRTAERRLRERERQLEALFEQVPATIWTTDAELTITAVAGAAASRRLREFVGRSVSDFLDGGDFEPKPVAAHRRALAGEPSEYEHHIGGGIFATHLEPLLGPDGSVDGVIGVDVDITEIRRVERELQASEARYRSLVEELPLVTYQNRPGLELEVVSVSPQVEELLGYPRDHWVGRPDLVRESIHPEDRERVLEEVRRTRRNGERFQLEYRMLRADGGVVWVLDETVVVRDEAGNELVQQGFLVDVTQRRYLEEQLRQSQKMEAIGRLAGGVAHDFNNLLTAIKGYGEFLLTDLDESSSSYRDAQEIVLAADRAAALTRQLLAFSRRQTLAPEPLSLNDVVAGLEPLLRRLIGEQIDLVVELDGSVPQVRADSGQLEQVILNLAVNARDALLDGGRLTISTGTRGGEALLRVADTGVGMGPEVRSHLFEPFFTTKEPGKGTGLGLATVYGIVEQSGGTIEVESAPGEGSSFTIVLPPAEPGRRILLVDDEPLVRDVMRELLERAGYLVVEASEPQGALDLAGTEPAFALLLTDVSLPGMTGVALAERLVAAQPELRVLFTSGFVDDDLRAAGATLEKPFTPEELLHSVEELLRR